MSLIRPSSTFDFVSDEQLYNQDLSSVLMVSILFIQIYFLMEMLHPNRNGVYLKAR